MTVRFSFRRYCSAALLSFVAVFMAACGEKTPSPGTGEASGQVSAVAPAAAPKPAGEVIVYTARKEHLIKPLFDQYTKETGVKIRYITDSAGPLLTRLKSEGAATPADMLLTVDVGNLWHAANQGVLRSVESDVLTANVPENLRDPQGRWFGLTIRARTMVYAKQRIDSSELSSYEALAEPQWKGRLCLRTSKKVYNQSLVASLIANLGAERTQQVVQGWVDNLAVAPFANDTQAMEAVAAGQCDVTLVNTYYFGRLHKEKPDIPLALFWANQADRGVHVNISGGGVTKYAKHPQQAQALLEWLSSDEAQHQLAALNQEFPVNRNVGNSEEVKSWGTFKADPISLATVAQHQTEAVQMMDTVGYR